LQPTQGRSRSRQITSVPVISLLPHILPPQIPCDGLSRDRGELSGVQVVYFID